MRTKSNGTIGGDLSGNRGHCHNGRFYPKFKKMKNNMKNIGFWFVICMLFGPFLVNAQSSEGHIRYLVTHNWAKKMAAVDYISKQQKDKIAYMNAGRSEWKVFTEMYFTPTKTAYFDSDERAELDDEGYSWRKDAFFVTRDFANNRERDFMKVLGKDIIVDDTIAKPHWKILNDLKEVAGHLCMNASWYDSLKQQHIIAWFAMDMPMPGGPERLTGLPGLILEANVNDGAMLISADKIDFRPVLEQELALPKTGKAKTVSEADYTAKLAAFIAEKRKAEQPAFWGIRY